MRDSPPRRAAPQGRTAPPAPAALALAVLLALAELAPGAHAQRVKPWVPPGADSLVRWVADAKVLFQANSGDSIGGTNYRPYEQVGNAGRRLLRSMGRSNMIQARALEALLDSLGLDTDVAVDPELPYFTLLMVRNPYRTTAKAVGFLYWWRGEDLRMQGAQFSGGNKPQSRVWWTGNKDAPYSWGVVDFTRAKGTMHFTLLRLAPNGTFWNLVQYEDSGFELGSSGSVAWTDVNGDLQLELVAWIPGERDSMFEECAGCPKLITELMFAERPNGFGLQDTRIVPSPYSTLTLFVRLLTDGNRAQAARLLKDPGLLDRAVAGGWNTRRNGLWKIEEAEPGTAWPQWLRVRHTGPKGDRRYTVYFELSRGRWVIRDWAERGTGQGSGAPNAAPPGGKR